MSSNSWAPPAIAPKFGRLVAANELLVGFLGFRTRRFDTLSAMFLYFPRHDCPSGEDHYVETCAGCFPDCCLRNYRLCARTLESSSTQAHSARERHYTAADCCQPGELPCGLGSRNWRYICGHD